MKKYTKERIKRIFRWVLQAPGRCAGALPGWESRQQVSSPIRPWWLLRSCSAVTQGTRVPTGARRQQHLSAAPLCRAAARQARYHFLIAI